MNEQQLIEAVDALVDAGQEDQARALVMQNAKELLNASQVNLEARIKHRHSAEDLEPCADDLDWAAQAARVYLSTAEAASADAMLMQVQAALQRFEHQNYGICSCCRREIPAARLARVLTANICIPCANERNGGHRR